MRSFRAPRLVGPAQPSFIVRFHEYRPPVSTSPRSPRCSADPQLGAARRSARRSSASWAPVARRNPAIAGPADRLCCGALPGRPRQRCARRSSGSRGRGAAASGRRRLRARRAHCAPSRHSTASPAGARRPLLRRREPHRAARGGARGARSISFCRRVRVRRRRRRPPRASCRPPPDASSRRIRARRRGACHRGRRRRRDGGGAAAAGRRLRGPAVGVAEEQARHGVRAGPRGRDPGALGYDGAGVRVAVFDTAARAPPVAAGRLAAPGAPTGRATSLGDKVRGTFVASVILGRHPGCPELRGGRAARVPRVHVAAGELHVVVPRRVQLRAARDVDLLNLSIGGPTSSTSPSPTR